MNTKNNPIVWWDGFCYLLALFLLLVTGSLFMVVFALTSAWCLALDLRAIVPAPAPTKEEANSDDDSEQTPDA